MLLKSHHKKTWFFPIENSHPPPFLPPPLSAFGDVVNGDGEGHGHPEAGILQSGHEGGQAYFRGRRDAMGDPPRNGG